MVVLSLGASLIVWTLLFRKLDVVGGARDILSTSSFGMRQLVTGSLTDAEREAVARRTSIELFLKTARLALRVAAVVAVPLVLLVALVSLGLMRSDDLLAATNNWLFFVAATIACVIAVVKR